jgi:flagellar basal-body rod protein FlgF
MDRLAFNAVASINEQALKRQALVHELSNVATVGFKRSFETALQSVGLDGAGFESRYQPQAKSRDVIDLRPGAVQITGNPLDIAMKHQSVLGVVAEDGTNAYTRRGDLQVTAAGTLQLATGHLVRGEGGPITLPPEGRVRIADDGSVLVADPQTGEETFVDRLFLRDASATPLARRTDGLFTPEGKPGTDIALGDVLPGVTSGALEGSNVSAVETMVSMMEQSRSFEMSVRIIKESKDLDDNGASMMRLG